MNSNHSNCILSGEEPGEIVLINRPRQFDAFEVEDETMFKASISAV